MNRANEDCVLYCLLKNPAETEQVTAAFRDAYPGGRIFIFQETDEFLRAVAASDSRCKQCCLATSCDYPEATLKQVTNAANYWFVPVVLIKDATTPVSVAPFNPVVLVDRPLAKSGIQDSIDRALELSGQYVRYSSQVERFRLLNDREVNILRLAAVGLPNKSIARRLDISIKTVEKNRRNAYEKLDISSAAEMASLVTFQKFCRSRPVVPVAATTIAATGTIGAPGTVPAPTTPTMANGHGTGMV
ncbi:MAG: helix-turn-helix transcriptional regulator [Planctomycetota bacterium]